jgi:hypothetical protein
MHYLHTLAHGIDQLAEGDRVYWMIAVGLSVVVAGCFCYDLRPKLKG